MNSFEAKQFLFNAIDEDLSYSDIEKSGVFFNSLTRILDFDYSDICQLCISCPDLVSFDGEVIIKNLKQLSEKLNIKLFEFKNLILKNPHFLFINQEILMHKLKLIVSALGITFKDALKYLYFYPELVNVSKQSLAKQITMLSRGLDCYGIALRSILKAEPKFLFISQEQISNVKKYFMHSFGVTEAEIKKVIRANPTLATESLEDIQKRFNVYYPTMFVKRDIKEILQECPEFASVDENEVLRKLHLIKDFFGISLKKACEFVRVAPNILFYNNPIEKFSFLSQFNIAKKYMLIFPKICDVLELTFPVKFVLTRVLGLDYEFEKIFSQNFNSFISRFLFMQRHNLLNHKDLLLSDGSFEEKYQISVNKLKEVFNLDNQILSRIYEHYHGMKNSISRWGEISVFEIQRLVSFSHSEDIENMFNGINFCKQNKELSKTKLMRVLVRLGFHFSEAQMVINKNKHLASLVDTELLKSIMLLKSYGFSQSQIVELFVKAPSLFCILFVDLARLVEEICSIEKCSEKEAVLKLV